jgi:hypothetical protein
MGWRECQASHPEGHIAPRPQSPQPLFTVASSGPTAGNATADLVRAGTRPAKASRRFWQVDDSVRPVPSATFAEPEVGQQARLVAVVGTPNSAAAQHEPAVISPARTT